MGFAKIAELIKAKTKVTPVWKEPPACLQREAGNPFLAARMEYEDRYGSAVQDAAKWRRHSMVLLTLCVVFACLMVWLAAQNKVVPYIVQLKHKRLLLQRLS